MDERPTFGSLFAGIGGIDLGLERAGWRGRWQVEYEPFCQRVLAHHWPDVRRYGDIKDVDWSQVEPVDLIAGGFPCQPFSLAGQRRGKDDDRWLWPEFERCLRALRPRFVLVENVPGLLAGGGMGAVLGGLADLGYDTEWESIPAAAVGAPHLRYRVWIIATLADDDRGDRGASRKSEAQGGAAGHAVDGGRQDAPSADVAHADIKRRQRNGGLPDDEDAPLGHDVDGCRGALADSTSCGRDEPPIEGSREHRRQRTGLARGRGGTTSVGDADSASANAYPTTGGSRTAVGQSGQWRTEPDVGRVAHGVPARVDRLRALGNAVVPQVVEFIGRRILEAEGMTPTTDPEACRSRQEVT